MLTDNFYLETERLQIVPFDYQYLPADCRDVY